MLALILLTTTAFCQELPSLYGAAPENSTASTAPDSNSPNSISSASASDSAQRHDSTRDQNSTSISLSANQIISLLHTRPEIIVDVKRVVADFFSRNGGSVQESSVTDEMLYSNIATNASLRQTISIWLRARGYATDTEFEDSTELPTQSQSSSLSNAQNSDDQLLSASDPSEASQRTLPRDNDLLPQELSNSINSGNSPDTESRRPSTPSSHTSAPASTKRQKPADTDAIELVHQSAPYNLQSLRDLYTQVPEQTAPVRRFGSDVFLTRGAASREMPIDLPIGPDYVLGAGDGLTVSLWGGVSQNFTRTIDREGRIVLPEAGSVVLAGLTLEGAQSLVQGVLAPQFNNAHVALSVSRLRTVRVYVVGDVQRPGAYDLSSLSTPLNALYAAGGPTSVGSLRTVRHYRGKILVCEVDLYDFLLHGIRSDVERLEPGDTILVPATGPQIEVSGMVKRPAIYEFNGLIHLSEALNEAGGLRVSAALDHIRIERIESDGRRSTVAVDIPPESTMESARKVLEAFTVQDGDRVIVAPLLPYSERVIYLTGHVVRPGKLSYHDSMKLSEAVGSYRDLLPEPSERGEIVRLVPPDMHPEAIGFSVPEVLAGNSPLLLQPFDTIRIRGRYETDAPRVSIRGEVLQPGTYALTEGMTAAQLVRISGGFRRSALLDDADLASYEIENGKKVVSRRRTVAIGNAVNGLDANADVPLKPGDVLTVHQVSGWNDIGASVTLAGEVTYPGTYGLQEGERLSFLILRAGGFRTTAYPDGAVLVRKQVKELEERTRTELIHQIETTSAGAKLGQTVSGGDDSATLQLLIQQQNQVLQRLRSQQSVGRLVIKISNDIPTWANSPADIEIRSGDVLTVPKRPGFVLVNGQVYNASAITFVPGKDAGWYLSQAGGPTDLANRKEIFVVRANGLVVGRRSGLWYGDKVLSTRLNPGDVVVVPQKIVGGSVFWKNMLATAQVFSSIAFTAVLALR